VEPGEVAAHLDAVRVVPAHRPRRQQQAAHPRQLRRSPRRGLAFGRREWGELRGESLGVLGGVIPEVVAGIGRHREVLHPPHRRDEPAETRARAGGAVFRETAVMVVIGI
jgi:hypothetical protein